MQKQPCSVVQNATDLKLHKGASDGMGLKSESLPCQSVRHFKGFSDLCCITKVEQVVCLQGLSRAAANSPCPALYAAFLNVSPRAVLNISPTAARVVLPSAHPLCLI